MKYVVYLLVAAVIVWAVVTVIRHVRRTLSGGTCSGDCRSCQNGWGCSRKTREHK